MFFKCNLNLLSQVNTHFIAAKYTIIEYYFTRFKYIKNIFITHFFQN